MNNQQKKQTLKRFTYICLSLTSILLAREVQADAREDDQEDGCMNSTFLQPSQRVREESKLQYNLRGIFLGAGNDFISGAIRSLTDSKFSHVGIILSDAVDERKWYCLESTGSAAEALNMEYPHVRVTPWEKIIRDYEGTMHYRLFVFDNNKTEDSNRVTDFVDSYDKKSYTKNPLKLIKALLGINERPNSTCLKTVFCSELTAKMLMDLDMLSDGIPGNFLPKHFASENELFLKDRIELTSEFKAK